MSVVWNHLPSKLIWEGSLSKEVAHAPCSVVGVEAYMYLRSAVAYQAYLVGVVLLVEGQATDLNGPRAIPMEMTLATQRVW